MLIARFSSNPDERPKEGWLLQDYTNPDNVIPIVSTRNRPIKVKSLEKIFEEIKKRSPRKQHRIKIYDSDNNLEGSILIKP